MEQIIQLPTTGSIDSRLGKLEVVNGYPTDETVEKLYDALDSQRAVQAYLWALPYVAMGQWQDEQRNKFGANELDYVDYFDFRDKLGLLTANATTPYSMAFPNLAKTGPLVFEFPEGLIAGGITDFWQRPITDTGALGPDKQKGGMYLILGPNDPDMTLYMKQDLERKGYFVFHSPTNNVWSGQRGLSAVIEDAKATIQKMRVYPYSQQNSQPETRPIQPETRHIQVAGREWSGGQPRGLAYWALLSRLINEEPVLERDRIMLATLVPLGIRKGEPFNPDGQQQEILIEASNVGELTARAIAYAKRFPSSAVWEGKSKWEYSLLLKETNQEVSTHTQLDERSSWFYEAVGVTVGMMGRTVGEGQVYLELSKDSNGEWLDGGKSYTLQVPKDAPVPADQFWSLTVYDNESRCFIDSDSYPDRSSRDDIDTNDDGSVDLYFGPTPKALKRKNWIKTLPDKGWFAYFRLYGPTKEYFDKTWVLPDIEPDIKPVKL